MKKGGIMSIKTVNNILVLGIIIFSSIASIYGFFSNNIVFENKTFQTIYGETVTLYGKGIYYNDSISMVPQARAQDIVTLIVAIPLLLISLILMNKNSLKGRLLLTGTVGYFLYTYTSYSFLVSYNKFFLLYVVLMSLSFFCFIINFTSNELKNLDIHFKQKFPKKYIGIFTIIVGVFICFLWLGMIISSRNKVPAFLEQYTTLVIQALDLGFIFPVSLLSGILLLMNKSLGYLLAPVVIVKGATLLLAVAMMAVFQVVAGINISVIEMIMFPLFAIICIINLGIIIKNMK